MAVHSTGASTLPFVPSVYLTPPHGTFGIDPVLQTAPTYVQPLSFIPEYPHLDLFENHPNNLYEGTAIAESIARPDFNAAGSDDSSTDGYNFDSDDETPHVCSVVTNL